MRPERAALMMFVSSTSEAVRKVIRAIITIKSGIVEMLGASLSDDSSAQSKRECRASCNMYTYISHPEELLS